SGKSPVSEELDLVSTRRDQPVLEHSVVEVRRVNDSSVLVRERDIGHVRVRFTVCIDGAIQQDVFGKFDDPVPAAIPRDRFCRNHRIDAVPNNIGARAQAGYLRAVSPLVAMPAKLDFAVLAARLAAVVAVLERGNEYFVTAGAWAMQREQQFETLGQLR